MIRARLSPQRSTRILDLMALLCASGAVALLLWGTL